MLKNVGNRLEVLAHYGFTRDPFARCAMDTADGERVRRVLGMAVDARAMLSLVGDRGIGKTRAVAAVLREQKTVRVVKALSADKGRITAGDIQEALILDLSDETPKKTKEVRARQLRRILGEASRKGQVVVVVEESHRLHHQTLRSIKNLRELEWMGQAQLFSVVLIGQSDPVQQAGLSEVRLRTEALHMHGLRVEEIREYIGATVGKVFDAEAIEAVCAWRDARNFLDLQEVLIAAMAGALAQGRDRVSAEDVSAVLDPAKADREIGKKDKSAGNAAVASVLKKRREKEDAAGLEQTG